MAAVKIGIIGTRGIPPAYGGFETMASLLPLAPPRWRITASLFHFAVAFDLIGLSAAAASSCFLGRMYLETVRRPGLRSYTAVERPAAAQPPMANAANAIFCGIPRIRGSKVVLNVDGMERQRKKWSVAGRAWYALGERLALHFPTAIVSDADVIRDYYLQRYGKASTVIAYGAPLLDRTPEPDLRNFTALPTSRRTATSCTSAGSSRRIRPTW